MGPGEGRVKESKGKVGEGYYNHEDCGEKRDVRLGQGGAVIWARRWCGAWGGESRGPPRPGQRIERGPVSAPLAGNEWDGDSCSQIHTKILHSDLDWLFWGGFDN